MCSLTNALKWDLEQARYVDLELQQLMRLLYTPAVSPIRLSCCQKHVLTSSRNSLATYVTSNCIWMHGKSNSLISWKLPWHFFNGLGTKLKEVWHTVHNKKLSAYIGTLLGDLIVRLFQTPVLPTHILNVFVNH